MKLVVLVVCVLVDLAVSKETYRAAILRDVSRTDFSSYIPAIQEAGRKNVDIVVLPSTATLNSEYNYDESVKNIAKAARTSRVYVAAHLTSDKESASSSLVVNRDGAVVAMYRKPVSLASNHSTELSTFSTDFGAEFTLLVEEELALLHPALLTTRNVVVTGSWTGETPLLAGSQLLSAWSYVSKCNVLHPAGVFGGHVGTTQYLHVADVGYNGRTGVVPPPVSPPRAVPAQELSQYSVKPLHMESSGAGYTDTVCHHKLCCHFYIKGVKGSKSSVNYGLAAFDGVRHFTSNKYIGTQTCGIFACAGLYKRSCDLGSQNFTDIFFEQITISGNFSPKSVQFPLLMSNEVIDLAHFAHEATKISIHNASITTFGILSRDYAKDHEALAENFESSGMFNDNVYEFIDYIWIRLRILIFVVSIYILEMM